MAKTFRKFWYVWIALLALVLMAATLRYREDLFPPRGMIRSWTAVAIAKEDYESIYTGDHDPLVCRAKRIGYFYTVSIRRANHPDGSGIDYKVDAYTGKVIGKMHSQ